MAWNLDTTQDWSSNFPFGLLKYKNSKIELEIELTKGQLNSDWIYDDIDFPKYNKNIVRISALKVFRASLGLPGIFLGIL